MYLIGSNAKYLLLDFKVLFCLILFSNRKRKILSIIPMHLFSCMTTHLILSFRKNGKPENLKYADKKQTSVHCYYITVTLRYADFEQKP